MNIEIIAGSPRSRSLSKRVALYLYKTLNSTTSHNVGLIDMQDSSLPPIQSVWMSAEKAPEEYRPLAERMFATNALILVSLEYNGGYSPAMKNFLDHFPKQARKAFGIATSSDGAMGGLRAAQQLLQLVPALFGIASPRLLITGNVDKKFDEAGELLDATFEKSVHDFITEFLWLAERLHSTQQL